VLFLARLSLKVLPSSLFPTWFSFFVCLLKFFSFVVVLLRSSVKSFVLFHLRVLNPRQTFVERKFFLSAWIFSPLCYTKE